MKPAARDTSIQPDQSPLGRYGSIGLNFADQVWRQDEASPR